MSRIRLTNPLGVSLSGEVIPPMISPGGTSRYKVTITIERGTEAVAGTHHSKAQNQKVEFDGADQLKRKFTFSRPAWKPRDLHPPDECDLSVCAQSSGLGDDIEYLIIALDAETASNEKVGLRDPGLLPIVLRE